MKVSQKLEKLRKQMEQSGLDACIVPVSDPHGSEYQPGFWNVLPWITGFTGSAGTFVCTLTEAGLWTDSRYFLQAEQQLEGTGIDLFRAGLPETPSLTEWLGRVLPEGSRVGVDGKLFSVAQMEYMASELNPEKITLSADFDPLPFIWTDRPPLPLSPLQIYPKEYAGASVEEKVQELRQALRREHATAFLVTALDETAWLLDIRGSDVEYNPVAICFAYVSLDEIRLFVEEEKLTPQVKDYLNRYAVHVSPYEEVTRFLSSLHKDTRLLVDKNKLNAFLYASVAPDISLVFSSSPVMWAKCIKNPVEIEGFRRAMIKDGIALVRFFRWLEDRMGKETITETGVVEKLRYFRSMQPLYKGDSFATIAGYGPHGAIVHYKPEKDTESVILPEGLLLIDSGAQYLDGTTDITRTVALGKLTPQQKTDFTLVLKGHIALASCCFPHGTRGSQIDVFARQYLWNNGLNYLHGTGHGIGHYLNVHEGPQNIRMEENPALLLPGMVVSNEPGIYRAGEYGIRCENLVLVREIQKTDFGLFYGFETLTLFPFDLEAIDVSLLSPPEINWLNEYHRNVYERLHPHLSTAEAAWLKEKTRRIH